MHLIKCIISATKKSIPFSNCLTTPVRMSGWNIDMSIAREKYLFGHGLWIHCCKPETGQVARIMRFTRNNYHYKIRKMKNESRSRAKQSLAHHHHHSCRSHATRTAFISSTTLRCLSIHLAVAPEISTSWYQYPFSSGFS